MTLVIFCHEQVWEPRSQWQGPLVWSVSGLLPVVREIDRHFLSYDHRSGGGIGLPLIGGFVYGLSVSYLALLETKKVRLTTNGAVTWRFKWKSRTDCRQISRLLDRNCTEVDPISVSMEAKMEQITLDYEGRSETRSWRFCHDDPPNRKKFIIYDVSLTKKAKKEDL